MQMGALPHPSSLIWGGRGSMSPPGKDSSYKRAEKGPIKPTYGLYLRASVPGRGCSGNKWHLWVIQHLRGSADARNNLLKGKQKGDHKVLKKDGPRGAQIKSLRAGLRGVRAEQPHRGTSGGFQQYPGRWQRHTRLTMSHGTCSTRLPGPVDLKQVKGTR